jgi:arabinan endo-1,5-alpha-L-arabinosidase
VEINPRTGKSLNNPPEFFSLASRPSVQNDPIEAPFIISRAGYYYLFVSFDYCCRRTQSDYKIAVGRSRRIMGPYIDQQGEEMTRGGGTVILETAGTDHGPGHNAVLQEGDTWWLLHHVYDANRGGTAVLRVRPIVWTADGWPRAGEPLGASAAVVP